MEITARNWSLAIAAAGAVVLVSACGGDDGTEPLSTEEVQDVLLPLADFPGTPTEFDEYFGETPQEYPENEEQNYITLTDRFGDHDCIQALEEMEDIDGENTPEASGERRAVLNPTTVEGLDDDVSRPSLAVAITSFAEETSYDEFWDDLQASCDGEVFTSDDENGPAEEMSLEAADMGDYRGLAQQGAYEYADGPRSSSGLTLSTTYGHHVIRVSGIDLPDELVEEALEAQLERLQEGPEDSEDAEAIAPGDRDLPEGQLSSEELEDLLLTVEDFSFPVSEVDADSGPDLLDEEYDDWGMAMMVAVMPAAVIDQTDADEACQARWDNTMNDLLLSEGSEDMAMAFAEGPQPMGYDSDEFPQMAAILLQSYPHSTEEFGHSAQWESFLSDCAGEWEAEGVQQSLEPIDIDGVDGYTAHAEATGDGAGDYPESMSTHVAHVDFGQTSMRIIGLDLSGEEMTEVVETQLQRLESAQ